MGDQIIGLYVSSLAWPSVWERPITAQEGILLRDSDLNKQMYLFFPIVRYILLEFIKQLTEMYEFLKMVCS